MRAGLVFKQKILKRIVIALLSILPIALHAQLDDPTRPPGFRLTSPHGKKATTNYFSLSSVRISPMRRTAVVNNRAVETGDMVNGAKVIAINPSSVQLKKQGKVFIVKLISSIMKKTRLQ